MENKSILFGILRWAAAGLAVVFLFFLFAQNRTSNADPARVAQAVTATLDMEFMQEGDNQIIKRLYGLNPGDYEACILYYPTTNMGAEELLIVKLASVSQQETVRAAVEKRLETQKNSFEGYGVEQYDLLTNRCVVEVRGNYVLFVVHANSAAAAAAFADAL